MRISSALRVTSFAPRFSLIRASFRLPGIGMIYGFLQSIHARETWPFVAFFSAALSSRSFISYCAALNPIGMGKAHAAEADWNDLHICVTKFSHIAHTHSTSITKAQFLQPAVYGFSDLILAVLCIVSANRKSFQHFRIRADTLKLLIKAGQAASFVC